MRTRKRRISLIRKKHTHGSLVKGSLISNNFLNLIIIFIRRRVVSVPIQHVVIHVDSLAVVDRVAEPFTKHLPRGILRQPQLKKACLGSGKRVHWPLRLENYVEMTLTNVQLWRCWQPRSPRHKPRSKKDRSTKFSLKFSLKGITADRNCFSTSCTSDEQSPQNLSDSAQ